VADARAQAEQQAQETLGVEVERVKSETEEKLRRELERARTELGQVRAEAMLEARMAAEKATNRMLEEEVARVRSETEARLGQELAQLREQAETARRLQAQAQQQAETIREQAARDVQSAAQKAAARAFEVEAVRIRAEAEARLREETERARLDAQTQLEREVARLRSENEERRAADFADVRAQMSELQEAARAAKTAPAAPAPRVEAPPPLPADDDTFSDPEADDNFSAGGWVPAVGAAAPAPSQWRKWAAGAGVLAVALVAAVAVLGRPATTRRVERPAPQADPAPASADKAPEITAEVTTRRPPTTRTPQAAPPPAPSAPPAPQAGLSGSAMLTVFSRIPLDINLDGKRIGTTDDGQLVVPPGSHRFELVSRRYNYRGEVSLSLQPGQMITHTVSLPAGVLRVRGAAGTEVWVEGEHIGALPLGDVTVPIGTREVVFRHPQQGERRQMIEVGAGAPAEVTAMFGAAPAGDAPAAPAAPAPSASAPPAAPPRLAPLSAPRPTNNAIQ